MSLIERWLFDFSDSLGWRLPIGLALVLGVMERIKCRRFQHPLRLHRWLTNWFLGVFSTAIRSIILPLSPVPIAYAAQLNSYGLLNSPSIPHSASIVLALLLIDLYKYSEHRLNHSIPLLWRFHQVHHSDRDLDVSTAFRFHPGEFLFGQALLLAVIYALAPDPVAVIGYVGLNITQNILVHSNLRLPAFAEKILGLVLITPRTHEVHHSIELHDQNSNFGAVFSIWDRVFRSHRRALEDSLVDQPTLGLKEISAAQSVEPSTMLKLPFIRKAQIALPKQTALETEASN